jgi:hypothetical protein
MTATELLATAASRFPLNRVTPQVDRGQVGGKNSELPIYKPSPIFVVCRRNRRQQGESGGNGCPECAGETIPSDLKLPELVQQNEVTPRFDIALHPVRSGDGANSIKVAHRHTGASIVEDRKPCPRREISQVAGVTMPVGEPVVFCDQPGQAKVRPPLIGQCSKDDLNLNIRCTPDHGNNFCGVFHDSLSPGVLTLGRRYTYIEINWCPA